MIKKENDLAKRRLLFALVEEELKEKYEIESIVDVPDFIEGLLAANEYALVYLEHLVKVNSGEGETARAMIEGTDLIDKAFTDWIDSAVNCLPPERRGAWVERLNGKANEHNRREAASAVAMLIDYETNTALRPATHAEVLASHAAGPTGAIRAEGRTVYVADTHVVEVVVAIVPPWRRGTAEAAGSNRGLEEYYRMALGDCDMKIAVDPEWIRIVRVAAPSDHGIESLDQEGLDCL